MTTETVKTAKDNQPSASGVTTSFIVTLGIAALVSWLAGVALHQGFGVPVPFMAAWLLIVAFLFLAKTTTRVVALGWYGALLELTPQLAASETAAAVVAEHETERFLDSAAFLDVSAKIRGE